MWPGAEFGDPGISVDDEMDVMKAILFNPAAGICHIPIFDSIYIRFHST